MSKENIYESITDALRQAHSMEAMLIATIEKLEGPLAQSFDKTHQKGSERFAVQNPADIFCRAEEVGTQLLQSIDSLNKFALHDPSDLNKECSSQKGTSSGNFCLQQLSTNFELNDH